MTKGMWGLTDKKKGEGTDETKKKRTAPGAMTD